MNPNDNIHYAIEKLAASRMPLYKLEDRFGSEDYPVYLSDKEESIARKMLKGQVKKRFPLRHPWLTGIPTLGIAPTVSKSRAYQEVERKMLRKHPELRARMGAAAKMQRKMDARDFKMETKRIKADQPTRATAEAGRTAATLGMAYLASKDKDKGKEKAASAIEKLSFIGTASKPLHELKDKELRKLRRNVKEERKTTEHKVLRGIGVGLGGAAGTAGGLASALGGEARADDALGRAKAKLDFARHGEDIRNTSPEFYDPHGKHQAAVLDAKDHVSKMEEQLKKMQKKTPGKVLRRPLAGAALAGAGTYGLVRLSDYLSDRRLNREMARRGLKTKKGVGRAGQSTK